MAAILAAALAPGCAGTAGEQGPEEVAGTAEPAGDPPVRGLVRALYRGRTTGDDGDHDVTALVTVDAGDPERDAVSGSLTARLSYDLDGGGSGDDPFFSLTDTEDGDLDARLYYAYVDVHEVEGLERLRFGRQSIYETPELAWFDGASLETASYGARSLLAGLYGGVPVHLYESSSDGDAVAGAYLEARPWRGGQARVDWMHIEDETGDEDYQDDLFGLGLWQTLAESLSVEGWASHLSGDPRDVRVALRWWTEDGLSVDASHYRLLETQRDRSLEVDPFFDSLRAYYPFFQTRLLVAKELEGWSLDLGTDFRRVEDEDDLGEFNRDYDRVFATVHVPGALPGGIDASVTGDVWSNGDDGIESVGADLTKEIGEDQEVSLGTFYALYKIDLFQTTEREHVRAWYARWRGHPRDDLDVELSYELDRDDEDSYHNLRVGMTWRF